MSTAGSWQSAVSCCWRASRVLAWESEKGEEEGEEGKEEGGAKVDASETKALSTLLARLPRRMPGVMGTALFERFACINHSCEPNAEVWLIASVTASATHGRGY